MSGRRVAVLDASLVVVSRQRGVTAKEKKQKNRKEDKVSANSKALAQQSGGLLPIPGLPELVQNSVRDAMKSTSSNRAPSGPSQYIKAMGVVQLDSGLICDIDVIENLAIQIHSGVLQRLVSATSAT